MNNLAKVRAEIEQRMLKYDGLYENVSSHVCGEILTFIDSLTGEKEEPTPSTPEQCGMKEHFFAPIQTEKVDTVPVFDDFIATKWQNNHSHWTNSEMGLAIQLEALTKVCQYLLKK